MTQQTGPDRTVGGRYRLVAELGSGGFGRVWKAHDEALHVDVAVKEVWLPPAAGADEQTGRLRRAEREARNAARLRDHPNIVAVHDVVIDDDRPWIVMQLIDGHSLEDHLTSYGPLPVDQAERVATALLQALGAAQQAGIAHRDIKPANVMLTTDGQVLLTDFGIAVQQNDTALTATGSLIGSVEYIAPERLHGNDGHPASDLFALGATLYQAVEGFSPFRRDTVTAALTAVLFEQPAPPQRAGTLTTLITRLLEKDPDQRPTVPQALSLIGAPSTPDTRPVHGGRPAAPPNTRLLAHFDPVPQPGPSQPAYPAPLTARPSGATAITAALLALLLLPWMVFAIVTNAEFIAHIPDADQAWAWWLHASSAAASGIMLALGALLLFGRNKAGGWLIRTGGIGVIVQAVITMALFAAITGELSLEADGSVLYLVIGPLVAIPAGAAVLLAARPATRRWCEAKSGLHR